MKKSVSQQLIDFLKANPSVYSSGQLQRMEWRNKNNSLATPRSIVRRLEENTYHEVSTPQHKQNLNGVLDVSYDGNTTYYQIREEHKPKPKIIIDESKPPIKDENGRWRPQFTFEVLSPNPSSSSSMTRL